MVKMRGGFGVVTQLRETEYQGSYKRGSEVLFR